MKNRVALFCARCSVLGVLWHRTTVAWLIKHRIGNPGSSCSCALRATRRHCIIMMRLHNVYANPPLQHAIRRVEHPLVAHKSRCDCVMTLRVEIFIGSLIMSISRMRGGVTLANSDVPIATHPCVCFVSCFVSLLQYSLPRCLT